MTLFQKLAISLTLLAVTATVALAAEAPKRKILFFTKSSAFEHSVISWRKGRPAWAEKVLTELGAKHNWDFTFSKDGSKFGRAYLGQFKAVFFYTTGVLCAKGTDGKPPMT